MAIRVRYEPAAVGLALASDLAGRGQLAKERQRLLEERRRFDEEFLERQRQFDVGQEFREEGFDEDVRRFDEDVRRFDLGRGDNLGQASFSNWIEEQKLGEGQRQFNLSLQERYARDRQDRRDRAAMERLANERALMAQQGAMARQNMASQQANIRQQQQNAANQGRWQQQRLNARMNTDWQNLLDQKHTLGPEGFRQAREAFIDKYSGSGLPMPFDPPQREPSPQEIAIQRNQAAKEEEGFTGVYEVLDDKGNPKVTEAGKTWDEQQKDARTRRRKATPAVRDSIRKQKGLKRSEPLARSRDSKKITAKNDMVKHGAVKGDGPHGVAFQFVGPDGKTYVVKDKEALDTQLNEFTSWSASGDVDPTKLTPEQKAAERERIKAGRDTGIGQYAGSKDQVTRAEIEQEWREYEIGLQKMDLADREYNEERQRAVLEWQDDALAIADENGIETITSGNSEEEGSQITQLLEGGYRGDYVLIVDEEERPIDFLSLADWEEEQQAPAEGGQGQPPLTPSQRAQGAQDAVIGSAPTAVPATTPAPPDITPMATTDEGWGEGDILIVTGADGKLYYDDEERTPVAPRDSQGNFWQDLGGGRYVASTGNKDRAALMYPTQREEHRRKLQTERMGQTADAIAASPEDIQVVDPDGNIIRPRASDQKPIDRRTGQREPEAPQAKRDRSGGESRYIRPKRRIINPETNKPYKGKRITLPKNATPEQIEAYDRAVVNAQAWADDLDKGREYYLESDEYEAEQEARRKDRRERLAREKAEQEERDSLPFRGFNPLPGGATVHAIRGIVPTTMGDIDPSKRSMSAKERREHRMRVEETDPNWGRRRYPDSVQDIMGQEYPDRIENRIVDVYDEVAPAPGVARGEYFGQREGTVRDSQVPQRVVVDEAQREFDDYDKQNQEVFEASDRLKEIQGFFEEHDILQGMNWEDIYKEVVEPLFLGHGPTSDTLAGPVSRTEDGILSGKLRIPKKLNKLKGKEKEEAIKQYFEMVSELYHLIPLLYGKDSPLPAHHGRDPLRPWMGNPDHDIWAGDDETNRRWDEKTGRKNRGRKTQGRWRTR